MQYGALSSKSSRAAFLVTPQKACLGVLLEPRTCLTVRLTMQAGGGALSSAVAVAAAAAAAGDAAPAGLLTDHLEAAAAAEPPASTPGSELGSRPQTAPAAGSSGDAARPGRAEPSAGGGSQGLDPAGNPEAPRAEAVQRLFELRLALGRPEEAAAGVLAATRTLQRAGSYEARSQALSCACQTHVKDSENTGEHRRYIHRLRVRCMHAEASRAGR